MSRLEDKLRLHFADKDAAWSATWSQALVGASWDEGGERHLLLGVEAPLVAARVVDAFVQALDDGARHLTLAWEGDATPVAREAAERLGVHLLDATDLPLPEPAPVAAEPTPLLAPGIVAPFLVAHRAHVPVPEPAYDVPEDLVAGLEAGALPDAWPPRRVRVAYAPSYDVDADLFPALDAAIPPLDAAPFIDPASGVLDASLLDEVDGLVHALDEETPLPWALGPVVEPEVQPAAVDPLEVMAMPWHHPVHAVAAPDEHVEVMPGNARPTSPLSILRPTQAPDWGLPWPRPLPPTDALAIADPSLWGARERVRAVREDLDRAGGASFGTVKPDGSAWLKRLQNGL